MAQGNGTHRADQKPSGSAVDPGGPGDFGKDENEEVIELSDIAIGTSAEDEAIIELTEDLVDEAMAGISGATGVMESDATELELSKTTESEIRPATAASGDTLISASEGLSISEGDSISAIEEEISKELDNYFQLEEETQELLQKAEPIDEANSDEGIFQGPSAVTQEQLESALERVVEKMLGQKIDQILNEIIERKVTEDIEGLKEFLLKRREKE